MSGSIGRLRGIGGGAEQRRQDLARIENFTIKNTAVSGRVLIVGAGEVIVVVNFPIWFTERPVFTFGGELDEGEFVQATIMPTVSAVVQDWIKKKPERNNGGYYVGANVICVTTGKLDQKVWLHWRAEGKGMSNPSVSGDDS